MLTIDERQWRKYKIGSEVYTPGMPKHWFAKRYRPIAINWNDYCINPVTGQKESCRQYINRNNNVIYFLDYIVYYIPIICLMPESILCNGRVVNREFLNAIANWQIHNRCFDYMECPFVTEHRKS